MPHLRPAVPVAVGQVARSRILFPGDGEEGGAVAERGGAQPHRYAPSPPRLCKQVIDVRAWAEYPAVSG